MLWGCIVSEKSFYTLPKDSPRDLLHISNAALSKSSEPGKNYLMITKGNQTFTLAVMQRDKIETIFLDLYVRTSQGIKLSLVGKGEIHVLGYFEPTEEIIEEKNHIDPKERYGKDEEGDEDDEDDEDNEDDEDYEDEINDQSEEDEASEKPKFIDILEKLKQHKRKTIEEMKRDLELDEAEGNLSDKRHFHQDDNNEDKDEDDDNDDDDDDDDDEDEDSLDKFRVEKKHLPQKPLPGPEKKKAKREESY